MSCETIETLLQESLLVLNHIDKYEAYLEYLHSEWLYTVDDLKLAFTNETTYLNLKIPARLKLELVALLDQSASSKIDEQEDIEEKDSDSYPATAYSEQQQTSKEWVSCYSSEYQCYYYYNTLTYESSWECPDPTLHYEYMEYVPAEDNSSSGLEIATSATADGKAFSKPKASEGKSSIFKASPKHTEIPDTPPATVRPVNGKLLPKQTESKAVPTGKNIFDNSDSSDDEDEGRGGGASSAAVSKRGAEEVVVRSSNSAKSSRPRSPVSSGSGKALQSNGHTVIYNKGVASSVAEDPFSTTRAVANSGRKQKQQQQQQRQHTDPPAVLAVAVPVPSRGIFDIDDNEEEYSLNNNRGSASDARSQYAREYSEFNNSFYMTTLGEGPSIKAVSVPVAQQQQRKHPPSTTYPQRAASASVEEQTELFVAPPPAEGPAALSGYQGYNSKLKSKPSPREGDAKSEGSSSRSASTKSNPHQQQHQDHKATSSGSTRSNPSGKSSQSSNGTSSGRNKVSAAAAVAEYSSSSEDEDVHEVQVRPPRRDSGGFTSSQSQLLPQPQTRQQQQQQQLPPSVLPSAPPAEPIYESPVHSKQQQQHHLDYIERITPPAAPPHLESPLSAALRSSPPRGAGGGGGLNSYIVSDDQSVNYLNLAMADGATLSEDEEIQQRGGDMPRRPTRQEGILSPPSATSEEHKPKKKSGIKKHLNKLLNLFGGGSSTGKKYKGSDPKVAQLIAMGFDEQEAMYALAMCDRDLSLSCKMLRHKDEEEQEEEEEEEDADEADHSSEPYR